MGDRSAIQWTDATWNPVTGCSKVSPGCAHCYAESLTERMAGQSGWIGEHRPWSPANAEHNVRLRPERLDQPLRWSRPRMVFVNSMSDLFHELVPLEFIGRVFNVMGDCPQHSFQVLTKRPERMAAIVEAYYEAIGQDPFPNVWLGTSIENRRYVGRADDLRTTPAAVRFISAEPLLGPLIYDEHYMEPGTGAYVPCWRDTEPTGSAGTLEAAFQDDERTVHPSPELDLRDVDWLIVGGESGAVHRRMAVGWVRDLRDAAIANGTAFFFKQWGGRTPKAGGRDLDGREWDELPQVRAVAR